MKIALFTLFVSASVALAASYPISISTTNGTGFGTTVINGLAGKINSGSVTNAAGSRVAYLSDTGGGGGDQVWTNAAGVIQPSGAGANAFRFDTNQGQFTIQAKPIDGQAQVFGAAGNVANYFDIHTLDSQVSLQLIMTDIVVTALSPASADGETPYRFDTSIAHTSGNLFEVGNDVINKFEIAFDGGIIGNGNTNNFTGSIGASFIGVASATAGTLSLLGPIIMSTNYTAADFVPVTGKATFPMSNAVLYMVTQTKTNVISDGR